MRKLRYFIVILLSLLINNISKGQDIHFSQFYFSPLNINPAHTGFFFGQLRFIGNFRNQWKLVSGGVPFVTSSASFDMHVLENQMQKGDIIGVGITAFTDKAGNGSLGTNAILGSLAYHYDMKGDGTSVIALGIQSGMVQTGFDPNELTFGDQIQNTNGVRPPTKESFKTTNIKYVDVNAGAIWNFIPSNRINLYLGVSTYHLTRPSLNFTKYTQYQNNISNRLSFQGAAAIALTDQFDVLPSILYMKQKASNEFNFGTALRFKTIDRKFNTPVASARIGTWYRYSNNSDAIIFMMGLEYMNIMLGMSYDAPLSSLKSGRTGYKGKGSYELALVYVLSYVSSKKKGSGKDIDCPKF